MELAIFLVLTVVGVAFSLYQRAQSRDQWEQAANDLGLYFESSLFSSAKITGRYNSSPVEVYKVSRGGKNNSKTYTVFEAGLPPEAPDDLVLAEEGFFAGVGKFMGMQDIEIGDPIFDSNFVIKGKNPAAVKRFLQQEKVTDDILELYNKYPDHFEVRDGAVKIEVYGAAPSFEIEMALDDLTRCFDAMRDDAARTAIQSKDASAADPFGGFPDEAVAPSSKASSKPESTPSGKFGPPTGQAPDGPPSASEPPSSSEPDSTNHDDQPDDWW